MLIPVRCFTCNKVLGNLDGVLRRWKEDHDYHCNKEDATLEPFFEEYRIERYCCRRVLLTFYSSGMQADVDLPPTVRTQPRADHPIVYLAR